MAKKTKPRAKSSAAQVAEGIKSAAEAAVKKFHPEGADNVTAAPILPKNA